MIGDSFNRMGIALRWAFTGRFGLVMS